MTFGSFWVFGHKFCRAKLPPFFTFPGGYRGKIHPIEIAVQTFFNFLTIFDDFWWFLMIFGHFWPLWLAMPNIARKPIFLSKNSMILAVFVKKLANFLIFWSKNTYFFHTNEWTFFVSALNLSKTMYVYRYRVKFCYS